MLKKTSQFSGKAKPNSQHLNPSESFCWVSLGVLLGFLTSTQPCILREVVDRPNLGRKRPLRSKGHHHNLPDKTRTVAGVVAKTINC
ncbi:hypothetical protein B5D77_13760 [Microcystis sp. MC19]|nr:hypothetical protein B5D77_13760 [Microcystis sp. MC19]